MNLHTMYIKKNLAESQMYNFLLKTYDKKNEVSSTLIALFQYKIIIFNGAPV